MIRYNLDSIRIYLEETRDGEGNKGDTRSWWRHLTITKLQKQGNDYNGNKDAGEMCGHIRREDINGILLSGTTKASPMDNYLSHAEEI